MAKNIEKKQELKNDWKFIKKELKKFKKEITKKETFKKQLPNLLTITRIFSPIIIIPTAMLGNLKLTAILCAIVALTDFFDGYFARKYDCKSKLGAWLDAISDKLFAYALIIPLILTYPLISTILIVLETTITIINLNSHFKGNKPSSKPIGKLKTWFLSITIILAYLYTIYSNLEPFFNIIFILTTVLQTSAIIDYITTDRKKELEKQKKLIQEINLAS